MESQQATYTAVTSRHCAVDALERIHFLPRHPRNLGTVALVHQHLELPLRSELRVLRDDAHVILPASAYALFHVARYRDRVDCRTTDIRLVFLQWKIIA